VRKLFLLLIPLGLSVAAAAASAQINPGVPKANLAQGAPPNVVAPKWGLNQLATGTNPLENPTGLFTTYGKLSNGTNTEPDENLYLHPSDSVGGPTDGYNYGNHFLIQGHEAGAPNAYLTRINLDVTDPAHRITLLSNGTPTLGSIDGDTYDPFNDMMLFTSETNPASSTSVAGVYQTRFHWTTNTAPPVARLSCSLGRAGYEGIHPDSAGNLYLAEDVGGSNVTVDGTPTVVRQPNSFIYRFKPASPGDLTQGVLQALQVSVDHVPITFHSGDPTGDALGEPIRVLHSGATLEAHWVNVHDTATDPTCAQATGFDANLAAKNAGATPLKRPENLNFVPGSGFTSFVFDETGDTDQRAGEFPGAAERGAWGSLMRVDMPNLGSNSASLTTIGLGDEKHNSFDNVAFWDKDTLFVAEDRGDMLHDQLNTLDSIWSFDLSRGYSSIISQGKRLLALGRDASAAGPGQEDNEPTGVHVSDGSTTQSGLLGTTDPAAETGVRSFFTEQHGDNTTYEFLPPSG